MFKHYLITRFNLKNPEWNTTKNNETLLNDDWMNHRLELFQNYCLPAVTAQSNKNFKWLIFFDTSTHEMFKERIDNLLEKHSFIKHFYINGMPKFNSAIVNFIESDTDKEQYIISSRLDNDDCIHKDYIDEIQKQFRQQDFMAIDVVKGYSLQISPDYMLGKKEHVFNPFLSLIETKDDFQTIWKTDHNLWKKEDRIIKIKDKRLWLSVIHNKNKVNEFDGYGDVDWNQVSKDFKVAEKIKKDISNTLIPQNKWRWLSFKNKIYVRYVIFSKTFKKSIGIYKLKGK
jgi:hypothetical protein